MGTAATNTVAGGDLSVINASLNGWFFSESGSSANTIITAGTGSSATGDTYNLGTSGGADRALGGLLSGSVVPSFGLLFTNTTGQTITGISISYQGETWRIGTADANADRLDFAYSTSTSLTTGTWTDANSLDYTNSAATTGSGSMVHSAAISGTLSGLSILNNGTFALRWTDFNVAGSDDAMGIDDFSMTFTFAAAALAHTYWDGNGAAAGSGGPGTWSSASANFSTSAAGTDAAIRDSVADAVIFGGTADTVTVSGTVEADGGLNFATTGYTVTGGTAIDLGGATNTITTDASVTATIATALTGSTGMIKAGAGTLNLTGASTYTGGTTIAAGTLQIGAGGSFAGNVTNNSALAFNSAGALSYGGVISGTGSVSQLGAGTTTLSGTNTYSGGTTISSGTLLVSGGSLGSGGITNNSNLSLYALTAPMANVISGSGTVTIDAGVTFTGANTYSGTTTINSGGSLTLGNNGTTGTLGSGGVVNNGSLTVSRTNSATISNDISGSGNFVNAGTGIVTLTGTNSYSGTTTNSNTLQIGDGGTTGNLGSGTVFNSSGTILVNHSNDITIANTITGGSLSQDGTGATTLSGNNTLSLTTVNAGSLIAASNTALGGLVELKGGSLLANAGITVSSAIEINAFSSSTFTATYNFGSTTGTLAAATTGSGFTISDLSRGNYNGAVASGIANDMPSSSSASSGTGASGGFNASNAAVGGGLDGDSSAYFEFTLDASSASSLTLTDFDFFTRSTGSGPTNYVLLSSADGYTDSLGTGSIATTSAWVAKTIDLAATSSDPVTFRLYAYGGSAAAVESPGTSSANWRIDDLKLTGTTTSSGIATIGSTFSSGTATFSGAVSLGSSAQFTATGAGISLFSGDISGAGGITKIGTGTVTLGSGSTNSYAGTTTVLAGKLVINSDNSAATGDVVVQSGGTLGGSGIVGGATIIEAGGTHAAGNSPGLQTFASSLTYKEGSTFEWELGSEDIGERGVNYDAVDVAGALAVNDAIFKIIVTGLNIADSFWSTGHTWDVFSADTITGDFTSFALYDSGDLENAVDYSSRGDFTFTPAGGLQWSAEAVPEPTNALAGLLIGAGLLSRRRNRSKAAK